VRISKWCTSIRASEWRDEKREKESKGYRERVKGLADRALLREYRALLREYRALLREYRALWRDRERTRADVCECLTAVPANRASEILKSQLVAQFAMSSDDRPDI